MNFRTDLAVEAAEPHRLTAADVEQDSRQEGDMTLSRIRILSDKGEASIGKPRGRYITATLPALTDEERHLVAYAQSIGRELAALLPPEGTVLVVGLGCLSLVMPAVEQLRDLFTRAGLESSYVAILLKTLAAAAVTRLCADLCRDGGSQALGSAVELAGAGASLLIAIPLLQAVTELLLGYFT